MGLLLKLIILPTNNNRVIQTVNGIIQSKCILKDSHYKKAISLFEHIVLPTLRPHFCIFFLHRFRTDNVHPPPGGPPVYTPYAAGSSASVYPGYAQGQPPGYAYGQPNAVYTTGQAYGQSQVIVTTGHNYPGRHVAVVQTGGPSRFGNQCPYCNVRELSLFLTYSATCGNRDTVDSLSPILKYRTISFLISAPSAMSYFRL